MDDANSSDGKKETKAGRKAFVPSDDQRATVRRMAAERLGHPVIAEEIGVSVPTLRKVFAEELRDRISGGNLFAAAAEELPAPQPVPAKPKRAGSGGRKSYRPTERDREKVAVLVSAGMTVDEIARAMPLSEPTLRKHFAAELETGALRKRGELLMALNRAALKGNVAALRESLAIMDRANLEALQDAVRGKGKGKDDAPAAPAPPVPADVGKKVQADIDAHGVVTKGPWADLVRPARTAG